VDRRSIPPGLCALAVLASVLLASNFAHAAPGHASRGRNADSTFYGDATSGRGALPKFSNRVGAGARLAPTMRGQLPATPAEVAPAAIELTAGYSLVPGGEEPRVPAELARLAAPSSSSAASSARGSYLVRFSEGGAESARTRLQRAGVGSAMSLPGGAWLVRMNGASRATLAAEGGSPWMRAWEPAFKLSPRIDRASSGRVEVTALLFPDGDVDATAAALEKLGGRGIRRHRGELNRLVRFELDADKVADAAALDDIQWLEPTEKDTSFNDRSSWVVQTGISNNYKVWNHGIRGAGQIVMNADSGIRTDHNLFWDPAHPITSFGHYPDHRKIVAYLPGSDRPPVEFGDNSINSFHGTHTNGTVAGNDDPTGTQPFDGVAKEARLWVMDLAGPSSASFYPPDDLNDLFLPSYVGNAAGAARISSNSWGSYAQGAYTLYSMQVDQFMWNHPDYLVAFANGNDYVQGSVGSPATAKNCLSVGGTGNGDLMNTLFTATSRGPTKDVRRKPTVCTPGDDVVSALANTRYSYASYSGTSMATPAAAGAVALARQYVTDGFYPTGEPVAANAFNPSAALLKAMAVCASRDDVAGYHAPDFNIGWGRMTLDDVLYFPGDSSRTLLIDGTDGVIDHEFVEYQVRVTDSVQPLRIALCWTDAPGNPAVVRQLVNNLNLVVTNGSVTYLGNRFALGTSRTGGSPDSANVEECVRIANPPTGLWTVRIEGFSVPVGPQPFALCITGAVAGDGGAVALDRFDYALEDTVEVEVVDTDATGPLAVTLTSPTELGGEVITLTGSQGVFRGLLPLTAQAVHGGDGRLSVSSGDALTATYAGASGAVLHATARVNVQSPLITDVHARAMTPTTTLVTWKTDLPASSRVHFGTGAALSQMADSSDLRTSHQVLLSGLVEGATYRYDVESLSKTGSRSRDSLGGAHRTFTPKDRGQIALLLGKTDAFMLETWGNAIAALGWQVDILTGAAMKTPLVGNDDVGLRHYSAVLWQPDPDTYPPLNAAQRSAVDSLVGGGARMLITGHDIGYALVDAASEAYTPETEAWFEQGLKARYYYDEYNNTSVTGVAGDPASGEWSGGMPYISLASGMAGDLCMPAPGTDGVGAVIWRDYQNQPIGIRWESNDPKGLPGDGVWGGQKTRLMDMFFEWTCLAALGTAHDARRTGVLRSSVEWLLGRSAPSVRVVSPQPGAVVTADLLPVIWSIAPDSGRAIAQHTVRYSLDGGETWAPLQTVASGDSGVVWDLGGILGGAPVPNSTRVMLRVTASDDGTPSLTGEDLMDATFTISRLGGDAAGPVPVAGSIGTLPAPVRRGLPATLNASFSDAETGGGGILAAEFSWGAAPASAGGGTSMTLTPTATGATASASLPTSNLPMGEFTLWLRARDSAGNWGPAGGLALLSNGDGVTAVGDLPLVDFLAPPSPNPFRGHAALRFGLSRAGEVRLEMFDVGGRRVRTLAEGMRSAGSHLVPWDGRDDGGRPVGAGIYFVRLITPAGTYRSRLVSLQ
jgi:hypothetical protein